MSAPISPYTDIEAARRLLAALTPGCELLDYRVRGGRAVGEPEECQRPAKWILHTTCRCGAGASTPICDPHHDIVIEPGALLVCALCGEAAPPHTISVEAL